MVYEFQILDNVNHVIDRNGSYVLSGITVIDRLFNNPF